MFAILSVGAGPRGYPAAIRRRGRTSSKSPVSTTVEEQLTAVILRRGNVLNAEMYYPSKALLESTELYQRAKDEFASTASRSRTLDAGIRSRHPQKRRAAVVKILD